MAIRVIPSRLRTSGVVPDHLHEHLHRAVEHSAPEAVSAFDFLANGGARCGGIVSSSTSVLRRFYTRHKFLEVWTVDEEQVHPSLVDWVDETDGAGSGLLPSRLMPTAAELIPEDQTYYMLCGSWVYGLASHWTYDGRGVARADFDMYAITRSGRARRCQDAPASGRLGPVIKRMTTRQVAEAARNGDRHAWEILSMPDTCHVGGDTKTLAEIRQIRDYLVQQVNNGAIPRRVWQDATSRYWKSRAPMLRAPVNAVSWPSVARWKAANKDGWPHKLAYFLLVDAILSHHAVTSGGYSVREPFAANTIARKQVSDCKSGRMKPDRFDEVVAAYLPNEITPGAVPCSM